MRIRSFTSVFCALFCLQYRESFSTNYPTLDGDKSRFLFNGSCPLTIRVNNVDYQFNITAQAFAAQPKKVIDFCAEVSPRKEVQSCETKVKKMVENTLQLLYLRQVNHLNRHLVELGVDMSVVEGGTSFFLNLLHRKRDLVTKYQETTTVCETGFNLGHSSLLWLQANPRVKVISFDLGIHPYVKPSAEYINQYFPGRLTLIIGDSRETLPRFSKANPNIKCDLFFVDGGHENDIPQSDMFWAIAMLNKTNTNSRILIDDLHLPDVREVYDLTIQHGLLKEEEQISDFASLCVDATNIFDLKANSIDDECIIYATDADSNSRPVGNNTLAIMLFPYRLD